MGGAESVVQRLHTYASDTDMLIGRRRGRDLALNRTAEKAPYADGKDAVQVWEHPMKQEIDGTARHELHHPESELYSREKSEMPATHGRSELSSS